MDLRTCSLFAVVMNAGKNLLCRMREIMHIRDIRGPSCVIFVPGHACRLFGEERGLNDSIYHGFSSGRFVRRAGPGCFCFVV